MKIVCNDRVTLDLLRRPRQAGSYADVCRDFASAAKTHELHLDYARGDAMGNLGKAAYAAGERRIAAEGAQASQ